MKEQHIPVPITTLMTHADPHLDEIEALRRLRKYGNELFPGVTTAFLRFSDGMALQPDSYFDRLKMLPVGAVPGTRFDDKDAEGKRVRVEGRVTCTAELVSAYMGITGEGFGSQDAILKEVLRADTESGIRWTELPELVKLSHRKFRAQGGDEATVRWTTNIMESIETQLTFGYSAAAHEKSLKDVFERLKKAGKFPDVRACQRLEADVEESMKNERSIFELSYIARCLTRVNMPDWEDTILFFLESLYSDHVEFRNALKLCSSTPWGTPQEGEIPFNGKSVRFPFEAYTGARVDRLPALFITSDHPLVMRASRHAKGAAASVTILRDPMNRNVVIGTNQESGIDIDDLVRLIRWFELPLDAEGRKPLATWEELGSEGNHPQVPQWHYFKAAQMMMNGTTAHKVERTYLTSGLLIEIVRAAFTTRGMAEFIGKYNIRIKGMPSRYFPRSERPAVAQKPVLSESPVSAAPSVGSDSTPQSDTPQDGKSVPQILAEQTADLATPTAPWGNTPTLKNWRRNQQRKSKAWRRE